MSRSNRMRVLVAAVLVGTVVACAAQAEAWCGWRGCGGCYVPCWSPSGCLPCYPVRCTSYCSAGCWSSCCCWEVSCCERTESAEPAASPTLARPSQEALPGPLEPAEPAGPEAAAPVFEPQPEPAEVGPRTEAEVMPETFPGGPEPPPVVPRPEANDLPVPSLLPDQPAMPPQPEAPAAPADSLPAPAVPVPAERSPSAGIVPHAEGTRGLIALWVPAEARVFINGLETKSRGAYREYVSYGLKPGFTYKYEIRAEFARQGRLVENTRTLSLTAGARKRVAFHLQAEPEEAVAALW